MGPDAQNTVQGCKIWEHLSNLVDNGTRIHMQWVPAHCGLEGNELVDTIANRGSSKCQSEVPVMYSGVCAKLDQIGWEVERTRYEEKVKNSDPGGGTRWHYETTKGLPPKNTDQLSDKDKRTYHQLRSGKCMEVRDFASKVVNNIDPKCPECGVIQTVRHIFLECKNAGVAHLRRIAWPDGITSERLWQDPTKVMMVWKGAPEKLRWRRLP